jgi:probable HAF family extracellular repeat protein
MGMIKVALLVGTILLAGPVAAVAQEYTVTNLGILDGYSSSYGTGVSESGQVVGYSVNPNGESHAFLYSNGTLQDLGTLGGPTSVAFGINASGQVTGLTYYPMTARPSAFLYSNGIMHGPLAGPQGHDASIGYGINASGQITGCFTPGGNCEAFLYSNGTTRNIGTLGGLPAIGLSINAGGQVTGYSSTAVPGYVHAFLYSNGAMEDLGTLGGQNSYGAAINATGQVTGAAYTTPGVPIFHAYLYSNGVMQDLGTLGGPSSYGLAINTSGQVTGYADTSKAQHAFLYRNGHMIDLNSLISSSDAALYTLTSGQGINDKGQIVVNATVNGTGTSVALLLTPTQPPP